MTQTIAVAALHDALVGAVLGSVALFLAVAAHLWLTRWAIARKVTHLITVLAFDIAEIARLGAVLGNVVLIAAVAAALLARLAWLDTITGTVTLVGTVGAGDDDLRGLILLLLAVLTNVTDFVAWRNQYKDFIWLA